MAENRIADAADPVLPTRAALADQVALHTCTRNCWGKAGDAAGCCRLDDRNFVQGPVRDTVAVLAYVSKRQGRDVPYAEVFIDAREGAALFPARSAWQHEQNFPALRPLPDAGAGYPCRFLGTNGLCRIYDGRPAMCRTYHCPHLSSVLEQL